MASGRAPRRLSVSRWLERSQRPIYVLDAKRRLLYANAACLEWLRATDTQVFGRPCDYHSQPPVGGEISVAGLCPPPSVLDGDGGEAEVWCYGPQNRVRRREAIVVGMSETAASSPDWLILLDDQDLPDTSADSSESADNKMNLASLHSQLIELHRRQQKRYQLDQLIGNVPAMDRVRRQVELAAISKTNVFLHGPAGSGREQIARTIHQLRGAEADPSLIPLDCRLLDAELLQATIQGFIRSTSELVQAGSATLLLLEVDQLERTAQSVLLDTLSIKELGISTLATGRQSLSACETIRPELAYMLSTLVIDLPPLRERMADIPLLVQAALESINAQGGHQVEKLAPDTMEALLVHPWRRNLEELFEVIREAHATCNGTLIGLHDLPEIVRLTADAEDHPIIPQQTVQLEEYLLSIERELLQRALRVSNGNRAEASRLLGISRNKILRRIEALGVSAPIGNQTPSDSAGGVERSL